MAAAPPAAALAAILSASCVVARKCDIFEEDGETPWMLDAPIVGGQVSVDGARAERRMGDLTFSNIDGALDNHVEGFWYDKVLKVYRGVEYVDDAGDAATWLAQIGEFLIDEIATQHFPHTTQVKVTDYTKKLLEDEFDEATSFGVGQPLDDVVRVIALNGGVTKLNIPDTGITLGSIAAFEAGDSRWKAITDLATAYGYEVFFDGEGYLVMREFRDPAIGGPTFTFKTGAEGNLVSFKKVAGSARLYNAVKVTGQKADRTPVVAVAENHDPSSPTSIERLGRREVYKYASSFISTFAQALDVATKFLKIHSLESFVISMEAICLPWLEATDVIDFLDPDPNPGDPRYCLLTDFTIPLDLSAMALTGKRVEIVA